MLFSLPKAALQPLQLAICDLHLAPETECVEALLAQAQRKISESQRTTIQEQAKKLVYALRNRTTKTSDLDSFLAEYDLSSEEGIALMCLAEALLRIPDASTMDALIRDKIGSANWESHLSESDSLFVNSATWALMLTGKVLNTDQKNNLRLQNTLKKWMARCGEPVIRMAIKQAMRILGRQFVFAQTIEEALSRAKKETQAGSLYSFDMLGEAALTKNDAKYYFDAYAHAIKKLGEAAYKTGSCFANNGVSVKISALSPRYDYWESTLLKQDWIDKVLQLAVLAKEANISFTIDAEEADRLEISLDIIESVFLSPEMQGYEGFGLAVQAYQKRAPAVIAWLKELAKKGGQRLSVRLVKGAYWDSEIKRAQESGLDEYPVFTRKISTDVSYLVCAEMLLSSSELFYLQFATHNAYTLAAIHVMAKEKGVTEYEFQRLHGMGESLYEAVLKENPEIICRVYAPVGGYKHLLAYLVRRLLENGANTSFVNRINQADTPVEELVADPILLLNALKEKSHPGIPIPRKLFGSERFNSRGIILSNEQVQRDLQIALEKATETKWIATPLVAGVDITKASPQKVYDPCNLSREIGTVYWADEKDLFDAYTLAEQAQESWDNTPVEERARCLERAADLFEQQMPELIAMAIREAGKTVFNAIAEIREAVDFCRYYANSARTHMEKPLVLPGPTGETNILALHGRGIIACISPWNFPLAIFIGQIAAALVTGNAVIAKPAEQTPLIAHKAIKLLYQAGIPKAVLHCLPGDGATIGAGLVNDPRVAGVMFTGSTETAKLINQSLANRQGGIVPFIAETGGQNVMIVDSSALPEQVVSDAIRSAFDSAGQRCSALRILCIQKEVADTMIPMLIGAMKELVIGDPSLFKTDVGPVIDAGAQEMLLAHCARMNKEATLLCEVLLPSDLPKGFYVAPRAYQITALSQLPREVFGPILHVILYERDELPALIDEINATGYGLTFGVHSRIQETIDFIAARIKAGNIYVNRNIIGAVVGVQPFGGRGLSGTGPKAGGPYYLPRLMEERVISTNTVAMGGNASLLSLE